jgi:uncharacterized membrane protein YhaH (DUF805 family)
MTRLLFSPKGRIAQRRYWQGMVILTVLSVLASAGAVMVSNVLFGLIGALLLYPYICVHGKRLHDIGTTAWWVIVVFIAGIVVSVILTSIIQGFFMTPELIDVQRETAERLAVMDIRGAEEGLSIMAKELLAPNLIVTVLSNAIIAFGLGMLATMPRENKHGPVPGQGPTDTFIS